VATVGDIDANVAKMTQGERRIPIRVRLPAESRRDLEALGALRVPTASGGTTRLDSVADLSFQAGPAKIDRFARKRQVTIEADLNNGAQLGQAMSDVGKLPTMKKLPAGVGPASAGDQEAFVELFTGFAVACCRRSAWCSACWCCCSAASSSRSPSCRPCPWRSAARSSPCWSPASRCRCRR
jgi:HAE1 family hydrophobic/amphiphilic exporter-1